MLWKHLLGCSQGADIHGSRRDIPQASNGEKFDSNSTYETILTRSNFRSDEDWKTVQEAAVELEGLDELPDQIPIHKRYNFEELKIVPQKFPRHS